MREKILDFVSSEVKKGRYPKRIEIEKLFHIDVRTYFPNNIKEVYENLGIDYSIIKDHIVKNRVKLAMKKRRRFSSKQEGRKIISCFIKESAKRGKFPTYREIDNKFKINTKSYFKSIRNTYKSAKIKYPREIYWKGRKTEEEKRLLREKIKNFVKGKINKKSYPTAKQIQKRFNIELKTYFQGGIRELYKSIWNYSPRLKKSDKLERGRNKIATFIKKCAKNGFYPGYREIDNLHLNLNTYFTNIEDAYKYANVPYEKEQNQLIALKKEEKLRKVAILILQKMGYKIIKIKQPIGEDIQIMDNNENIIPVELKAYSKNLSIPNPFPFLDRKIENEFEQLKNYIKKKKSPYGILITSTDKIRIPVPENIKLLNYRKIMELLQKYQLEKFIRDLEWIRNTATNKSKILSKEKVRKGIIKFFKKAIEKKNYFPTVHDVQKRFNIDLRTYFPNTMKDIYKQSRIPIPKNRINRFKPK